MLSLDKSSVAPISLYGVTSQGSSGQQAGPKK
uniref:Uncharacterized protein n=1 Tax=Arundo donax TaxID=35708 RepID=A0A0A9H2N0_ARUDO